MTDLKFQESHLSYISTLSCMKGGFRLVFFYQHLITCLLTRISIIFNPLEQECSRVDHVAVAVVATPTDPQLISKVSGPMRSNILSNEVNWN